MLPWEQLIDRLNKVLRDIGNISAMLWWSLKQKGYIVLHPSLGWMVWLLGQSVDKMLFT